MQFCTFPWSKNTAQTLCLCGIYFVTYSFLLISDFCAVFLHVTRDSLGFALKATHSIIDGEEHQIFKDPITDKIKGNNFKKSQKGMCYVYKNDKGDIVYTDEHSIKEMNSDKFDNNLLELVFKDGKLIKDESLMTIRNRLHNGNF